MTKLERTSLIEAALAARLAAYAPYSNFKVGAALRTSDGVVFVGCNVENASYGMTQCAERVAVGAAIAAGEREFDVIAIASDGGVPPCGACRQVLAEFSHDLVVLMADVRTGSVRESTIGELLPSAFDGSFRDT